MVHVSPSQQITYGFGSISSKRGFLPRYSLRYRPLAKKEVLRIETLSESEVLSELQQIMRGCNYSWYSINQLLQEQLEDGKLDFTFVDGDVLFEWNNLCSEKRLWDRKGHLSQNCAEFNEDCLVNLKILPFKASLGHQGLQLVTANIDKLNLSAMDLSVGFDKRELSLSTDSGSEYGINDKYLSSDEESEGSVYNDIENENSGISDEEETVEFGEHIDSGIESDREDEAEDIGFGDSEEDDEVEEVEEESEGESEEESEED